MFIWQVQYHSVQRCFLSGMRNRFVLAKGLLGLVRAWPAEVYTAPSPSFTCGTLPLPAWI